MSIALIPVFLWGLHMVDLVLKILAWGFAILVLLPLGLFLVLFPPIYLMEWLISVYDKRQESKAKGEIR